MKTVFITGAAHGIGLATAMRFASQGWFVGLYDINEAALQTLLQSSQFPMPAGRFAMSPAPRPWRRRWRISLPTEGRLDVLVNNAGVLSSGRFEDIPAQAHEQMIAVNVGGLTRVAHAAFELLRQTPGSTLVNLCSVSSVLQVPLLAVYSATKFYVNGLTEALHIEWGETRYPRHRGQTTAGEHGHGARRGRQSVG